MQGALCPQPDSLAVAISSQGGCEHSQGSRSIHTAMSIPHDCDVTGDSRHKCGCGCPVKTGEVILYRWNLSARSQPDLGDLGSISARLRSRRSISTVIPDLVSISTIHLGSISGDSHTSARARTTNISHPTHLPPHPTPSPPLAPSLSPAPWALLPGLCAAGRRGPREMRPRCGRDMAEVRPR